MKNLIFTMVGLLGFTGAASATDQCANCVAPQKVVQQQVSAYTTTQNVVVQPATVVEQVVDQPVQLRVVERIVQPAYVQQQVVQHYVQANPVVVQQQRIVQQYVAQPVLQQRVVQQVVQQHSYVQQLRVVQPVRASVYVQQSRIRRPLLNLNINRGFRGFNRGRNNILGGGY